MTGQYYKNNTYDQINAVVLGSYYTADYFRFITNASIREPLMRISDEINQDLQAFEDILIQHGSRVLRPALPTVDEFIAHHEKTHKFLSPPIQPRNCHSVIGNRMYKINPPEERDRYVDACVANYNSDHIIDLSTVNKQLYLDSLAQVEDCYNPELDTWYCRNKYNQLAGPDWPQFQDYVQGARSDHPLVRQELIKFERDFYYEHKEVHWLDGPNVLPVDDRIVVDSNEYCDYASWVRQHMDIDDRIVSQITTKSRHTDGCFVILGQRTILGIDPLIDYTTHFPGYHVIGVPQESYQNYVDDFLIMKRRVGGRWWVPGEERNENFTNFVELYLSDWTGHVYETVFDVNVLALNSKTVCVSNHNPDIFSQLKQRGIDPIVVPWRHRFFVDCGLHCLTLDLCRGNVL